jgi:uncharacterized membrane protein YGL010W
MRTLEENITQYAAYHRDRRNIATHFAGIPLIVFSVILALTPITIGVAGASLSVALITIGIAALYYLRLDLPLGLAMTLYLLLNSGLAAQMATPLGGTGAAWAALGIFVAGWALQFWGHRFEGIKPAFFDDIMGLAIGPLFIMTEVFFTLGLKQQLKSYVEARVGPTLAARNGATIGPREA